jgi:hypothetical protein
MSAELYAGIVVGFGFGFVAGSMLMLEICYRLMDRHARQVHGKTLEEMAKENTDAR